MVLFFLRNIEITISITLGAVINCNPRNTITEINEAIMSWLQHAIDRVKYANKKHQSSIE